MRRCLCLLPIFLAFGAFGPLHAQDKEKDKEKEKKAKPGPVQISWHGQSFFTITSSQGTVIVTDPHQITEYGRPVDKNAIKANILTMSHNHSDHTQLKAIENYDEKDEKKLKIFKGLKPGKRGDWNVFDEKF